MTTTEQTPAAPALVRPEPDSRLDALAARYDEVKTRADAAKAELDDITTAIKAELAAAAPGRDVVVLESSGLAVPLRLSSVLGWRFDAKRCKAEDPHTYVKYATRTTSWRLERVKG